MDVELDQVSFSPRRASLIMRLGAPTLLVVSVQEADATIYQIRHSAAARSQGFATLDGLRLPIEVVGLSRQDTWSLMPAGSDNLFLHAAIIPSALSDWLRRKSKQATDANMLVYQVGEPKNRIAFFQAVFEGNRFATSDREKSLTGPTQGTCFLRPAWKTNAEFVNEVVTSIRAVDPSLLGWRVLSHDEGRISLCISDGEPLALENEDWELDAAFGEQGDGSVAPMRITLAHEEPFAPVADVLPSLLGDVAPSSTLFGPSTPMPPAPRLVKFSGRTMFARTVVLSINAVSRDEVDRLAVDLMPRPPCPSAKGTAFSALPALVHSWSETGNRLLLVPEGDGWALVASDPAECEGVLAATCLSPALAAEGGVYFRPLAGDPRIALVTSGASPLCPGTAMVRDDTLEKAEIDIAMRGARLEFTSGETALNIASTVTEIYSEEINATGSVRVNGDLDVS